MFINEIVLNQVCETGSHQKATNSFECTEPGAHPPDGTLKLILLFSFSVVSGLDRLNQSYHPYVLAQISGMALSCISSKKMVWNVMSMR